MKSTARLIISEVTAFDHRNSAFDKGIFIRCGRRDMGRYEKVRGLYREPLGRYVVLGHEGGVKAADGTDLANQRTLRSRDRPRLSRWAPGNHRGGEAEEGVRAHEVASPAVMTEEGATSHGHGWPPEAGEGR